ncbi:GNAT family N-acetyltransferase [Autumnicola edwardsiae]|uniref:GNAT family N-acetyltransferase n=1 Tax=Autumnicola edwardsiae TaxID=3075594 RepID=A0ABU3CTS7_9FLAO|nr:GNAT family N-acetyltransferase [Zunongwangia sp. F297]MDT0649632.1 GNAT family N-acetyltransferase [Zunongwangia sp. F297]
MEIRKAEEKDIPGIIQVLKASLGETDLPVSEDVWRYKHVANPFGPSIVLVAEEANKIVGVRAFMRWQWQLQATSYCALRAVDTATHPNFQGKGIFKKLTLKALEEAEKNGDNFVFNTPNEQSRPGYLKMGWEQVDNVEVGLRPAFNSFWKLGRIELAYNQEIITTEEKIENLCERWNTKLAHEKKLFTPKSREYLYWRYEKNQLQSYEVYAEENIYLAAYVKRRGKLRELRVAECIYLNSAAEVAKIKRIIRKMSWRFGVQFCSFSPELLSLNFTNKGKFGPMLTFREIYIEKNLKGKLLQIENWNSSIGDLELF